jgi:hypothetical protein
VSSAFAAAIAAGIVAASAPAYGAPGWLFENPSGTLTPNNIIWLMQLPPDQFSRYAPYASYMYESVILPPRTVVTVNGVPVRVTSSARRADALPAARIDIKADTVFRRSGGPR